MNKRFTNRIKLLFAITLSQFLLILAFISIVILILVKKQELDITIVYWFMPIIILIILFLVFFNELKKLIWMLRTYKITPKSVITYLNRKVENASQIQNINRSTFRFRIHIKDRLYQDALLALEKNKNTYSRKKRKAK